VYVKVLDVRVRLPQDHIISDLDRLETPKILTSRGAGLKTAILDRGVF